MIKSSGVECLALYTIVNCEHECMSARVSTSCTLTYTHLSCTQYCAPARRVRVGPARLERKLLNKKSGFSCINPECRDTRLFCGIIPVKAGWLVGILYVPSSLVPRLSSSGVVILLRGMTSRAQ